MDHRRDLVAGLAALVAVAACLLWSGPASANGGGVAGYTGKPNAAAPSGESCNKCHSGGAAPQVSITGPSSLAAGQSAEYTLTVRTAQARAAAGVAASEGAVLTPVAGLRESFGELVQSSSVAAAGGQATFRFRVTAPASGAKVDLWAVGLACNGSGTGGDRAAHATTTIAGGGGSSSSGGADAGVGSSSGSSGAGSADGGAPRRPNDAGVAGASDDDEEDGDDDPASPSARPWGHTSTGASCAAAPRAPGSGASPFAAALALGVVALAFRARRREALVGVAVIALASTALLACSGASTSGDGEAGDPGAGGSSGAAKVDVKQGRDETPASCFAACQNTAFSCQTKAGTTRTTTLAELSPSPTGCVGSSKAGASTQPLELDCTQAKACWGPEGGRTCVSAAFSALSFAFDRGGAAGTTICTRVE